MAEPCRVSATIDLEADGKRFGALNVPHSSNESAWGAVRVPIVVIRNGAGPTLLFTGGNHGDEYEGPIALLKLARSLEPHADRRPRDPDPGAQPAGRARRHPGLADRSGQPEPCLSRPVGRHCHLDDRGLRHSPHPPVHAMP